MSGASASASAQPTTGTGVFGDFNATANHQQWREFAEKFISDHWINRSDLRATPWGDWSVDPKVLKALEETVWGLEPSEREFLAAAILHEETRAVHLAISHGLRRDLNLEYLHCYSLVAAMAALLLLVDAILEQRARTA